jgi:hypothetical protein
MTGSDDPGAQPLHTLVSVPVWGLVVMMLALGALVAIIARLLLRRLLAGEQTGVAAVAGPLMPALGAVFALLAALSLSSEAAELRKADQDVAAEAAAASRLAWAGTTPGVDRDAMHDAQLAYLRSTLAEEWSGSDGVGDPGTRDALIDLERVVRAEAASSELGSAQAGELLGAMDAVTSLRRERLATSAHDMPVLYLVVVVAAGLALVINAAALAVDRHRHVAWLTSGLVVVVALVIALLLAITSPFRGGFIADRAPIDDALAAFEDSVFRP